MIKPILPPATIGIIGGGQLGRMMTMAAKQMGYQVVILDPQPNSPAGQVADGQIIANYDDLAALRALAARADLLTYEFENVDQSALKVVAETTPLPQGTRLLELTADRLLEKNFMAELGLPVTAFTAIDHIGELDAAVQEVGLPAILKTRHGGYDGHGQWEIADESALAELIAHWQDQRMPLILEKRLSFDREVSMMVTRDGQDQVRTWPLAENEHDHHILQTSWVRTAGQEGLTKKAAAIAKRLAQALDLRGMLGIEFFVLGDDLYINELAPRPHNSGHYSIEAANVSQFEGHIRSITGLPIPPINLTVDSVLMLNLLGDQITAARTALPEQPAWHFHDYGKALIKPQRKMGHITVTGDQASAQLRQWGQEHDNT